MSAQTRRRTIKAERMPFGRWLRLIGWRHLVAIAFCVWALFPVFYVITLAFSGGNTLTAACPPEKKGLEALDLLLPARRSRPTNFETLLTSDQWPFLDLVPEHRSSSRPSTRSRRCSWARRRRSRSAGSGSVAGGLGLLTLMLVQMFPAVLAITAIYSLLTQFKDVFPLDRHRVHLGPAPRLPRRRAGREHVPDEGLLRHDPGRHRRVGSHRRRVHDPDLLRARDAAVAADPDRGVLRQLPVHLQRAADRPGRAAGRAATRRSRSA